MAHDLPPASVLRLARDLAELGTREEVEAAVTRSKEVLRDRLALAVA